MDFCRWILWEGLFEKSPSHPLPKNFCRFYRNDQMGVFSSLSFVLGKHHIIATFGSNIIMSQVNNIIFTQAKTSLLFKSGTSSKMHLRYRF